ncbi:MAG: PEGA domain-containing protein [Planctomycetaceae bacterium]|nr:PEGA domain-containing protein [Planctomycetaceae bacterium]
MNWRFPPTLVLLLAVACSFSSGCVSRRMTVRSDPPGALVEVDGKRIGVTPVAMDFTYYGTREITLSKPGYETLSIYQPVRAPLYQKFPLDFFSNHFLPYHVTDRHDFTYKLARQARPIDEESNLIQRGRNFRSQAQVGSAP